MERIGRIINRLAILNRIDNNNRLNKYDLTANEGIVLMMFKNQQYIYQESIIKELQIDKSAVTRLLHNMEVKKLIKRIQDKNDKRCYLIEATNLGKEKQDLVDLVFSQKDEAMVEGLSKKELDELRQMLALIKNNLGGNCDE